MAKPEIITINSLLTKALVCSTLFSKCYSMKAPVAKTVVFIFLLFIFIHGKAQKVYMKAHGVKSGMITDNNPNVPPKFQNRIELTGYSFESSSSGTGKSRPPMTITKNNGPSSIQLYNAQVNNEQLKIVIIEIYKVNSSGVEVLEQTITLNNVTISSFRQHFDTTPSTGEAKGPTDEIRLTYQKMTVN
jgi:type VI secretion system Hcp family effector